MRQLFKSPDTLSIFFSINASLFLCLLFLGTKNFSVDEFASLLIVADPQRMLIILQNFEGNMWLYYLLLFFWKGLGFSEFSIRLLSVIPAVATIPVIFFLTRDLFGQRVARITTILFPLQIFFLSNAQNARSYSLLLFCTTFATYAFIRYLHQGAKKDLFLFFLFSVLSVYSHLYAVLVIFSQYCYLFIRNQKRRQFLLLIAPVIAVAILPIFIAPSFHSGQISWIPKPSIKNIIGTVIILSGDFLPMVVLNAFLFITALFSLRRKTSLKYLKSIPQQYIFLLIWLLIPIITAFFFSLVATPIYTSTYFLISLVPFTIGVAILLSSIRRKMLFRLTFGLIIIFSIVRLYGWYTGGDKLSMVIPDSPEEWQKASMYLSSHTRASEGILYYPSFTMDTVGWYAKENAGIPAEGITLQTNSLSTGKKSSAFDRSALLSISSRFRRLWWVKSDYVNPNDTDRKEVVGVLNSYYKEQDTVEFNHVSITLYTKN